MKNGATVLIVIAIAVLFVDGGREKMERASQSLSGKDSTSKAAAPDTSGRWATARRYSGSGQSEPIAAVRQDGCKYSRKVFIVPLSEQRYPASAWHLRSAWRQGAPRRWHLDRSGAEQNRDQSLRGIESNSQLDRDEVPIAASREGGAGADVAYIPFSDNRGSGSYIGNYLEERCDGQPFRIKITE